MKKIVTMTVLFCTIFSTTAFAASKSGTFNFLKHQAKGYLNTHKFYNAEASTVRTGGKADKNMHVALYATSKKEQDYTQPQTEVIQITFMFQDMLWAQKKIH